jgi:hypothetical protein
MTVATRRRGRVLFGVAAGTLLSVTLAACVGPSVETPTVQPSASAPPVTVAPLTNQEGALQDLRGCLAVNDVLNVFYLIDHSGSLTETDPQNLRQGILANSLASLAQLSPQTSVNWAAGVFDAGFVTISPWSKLVDAADAERLAVAIPPTQEFGWTNWEAGVLGAQASLAEQAANAGGCAALIWLTDGEILLEDGPAATTQAFARLCTGDGSNPGVLQQLRTDQVVVFGVLLNFNAGPEAATQLVRLVEGVPDSPNQDLSPCGTPLATDSRGTVTEARDANALAREFDKLQLLIAGGTPGTIDPGTGVFQVPVGVSRFVLQFAPRTEPWSLTAPDGTVITQGELDSPAGVEIADSAGGAGSIVEVRLDSVIEESRYTGSWTVADYQPNLAELYRFSDLQIQLEEGRLNGGSLGVVSGQPSVLTALVLDRDGQPADLAPYDFEVLILERVPNEPLARVLARVDSAAANAELAVDLAGISASPGGIATVDVTLQEVSTKVGQVPLEGPIASLRLTVLDPSSVPSSLEIRFTSAAGSANAPAEGEILADPPADGGVVDVIVRDAVPLVVQDEFDREFAIEASATACEGVATVCGQIGPGQSAVPLQLGIVEGEDPEFAVVTGELLVELQVPADEASDPSVRLIQSVPFTVQTERPINLGLLISFLLLLLLLGLSFPVLLAWLLKRGLVRLQHGRLLQRAEFPVVIKDGSITVTDLDPTDEAGIASAFRNLPPNERVRTYTDARLGTFAVRVPLSPLQQAWFSLTPPVGTRVIAKQTGVAPRRLAPNLAAGTLIAGNGVLSSAWGVAIQERELQTSGTDGPLPGVLVVYLQPVLGQSGQYAKRLLEIMNLTDWRARVRELAQAVATGTPETAGDAPSESVDTSGSRRPARPSPGGEAVPQSTDTPPRPPGRSAPSGTASPTRSTSLPPRTRGDDSPPSMPRPPGR